MAYLPVGGCPTLIPGTKYSIADMRMWGSTGKTPGCPTEFKLSMTDPALKKVYEDARRAALATAEGQAQRDLRTAQEQQAADIATAEGPSKMKMYLLIGGGLAAFALVMVLKKKKSP